MKARGAGVFNLPNKPGGALEKVIGKIYEAQRKPGEDIEAVLSRIAIPIDDVKQMFRDKALADAEAVEGEEAAPKYAVGDEVLVLEEDAYGKVVRVHTKEGKILYDLEIYGKMGRHVETFAEEQLTKGATLARVAQREDLEAWLASMNLDIGAPFQFFSRHLGDWKTVTVLEVTDDSLLLQDESGDTVRWYVNELANIMVRKTAQAASHWDCPNHPEQEEFVVYPPIGVDKGGNLVYAELGVIVGRYGKATNRWEDRTAGVQPHIAEAADEEESAYCTECGSEATWVRAGVPVAGQPQEAEIAIGDIITDGLVRGKVIGEGTFSKRKWPMWKIELPTGEISLIGKWDARLVQKAEALASKPVATKKTAQDGETHSCIVCGKSVTINPYGYSPPSTVQPIQDTGLWRDPEYGDQYAGGYVCAECIPELNWTDEDWATIEYDWGIQRPAVVGQVEEKKEEEEPKEPEKEIVSCLRCENFNEETQKCNLQEKEDIDNIIAFVLQNGCNLFEGKEEYEEAPPEGEKMEEEKVVKQELPYQAQLGPGYSVDEPDLTEKMGPVYTVRDTTKNVLVGSVFPEVGVVRLLTPGEGGDRRQEFTGLEKDKDILLRYLIQQYESKAGPIAVAIEAIRKAVTPGLLDPDVLAEEWAQNRILDIMAERFPHVSHSVVRQALAQILESWRFLRKPYFPSKGRKSMVSGKGEASPTPDPAGFEDWLGGFTVRTGRSGRSTMVRRIGSPGKAVQSHHVTPRTSPPCEICGRPIKENTWGDEKYCQGHTKFEVDKFMETHPESALARFRRLFGDPGSPGRKALRCKICGKPVKENTEGDERYCQGHTIWEIKTRSQKAPDPVANALYQEYLAFVREGSIFFPDEIDSAMHFLTNIKGLDPSEAKEVISIWYGGDPRAELAAIRGKKAQVEESPGRRTVPLTDDLWNDLQKMALVDPVKQPWEYRILWTIFLDTLGYKPSFMREGLEAIKLKGEVVLRNWYGIR